MPESARCRFPPLVPKKGKSIFSTLEMWQTRQALNLALVPSRGIAVVLT